MTKRPLLLTALAAMLALMSDGLSAAEPNPVPAERAVSFTGSHFASSEVDAIPRPVEHPSPDFQPAKPSPNSEFSAVLTCIVDEKGIPTQIQVLRTNDQTYADAAVRGLAKWRFSPAMKDGKAVPCVLNIPFLRKKTIAQVSERATVHLRNADITSVLQTYEALSGKELLVVPDDVKAITKRLSVSLPSTSKDESLRLLEQMLAKGAGVEIVHTENGGLLARKIRPAK